MRLVGSVLALAVVIIFINVKWNLKLYVILCEIVLKVLGLWANNPRKGQAQESLSNLENELLNLFP